MDKDHRVLDAMGGFVAGVVMAVYAFTVIAPYVSRLSTNAVMLEIIKSNKSTVDLITTAVVMFFFGASVQRRRDQETLNTAINTVQQQAAAISPTPADAIPVAEGERKVVVGTGEASS